MNLKSFLRTQLPAFLLLAGSAHAQTAVQGTVLSAEDKSPLPGATVVVEGTTRGTSAGADGRYALEAVPGEVLVFSFVGFEDRKVTYSNQTTIDVELEPQSNSLDEVVVMGYSSQRKTELSSAVVSLDGEQLTDVTSPDIGNMLQGKAAGVLVYNTSGQPGSQATIRIRGTGSITAASDPLYVVDGIIGGTFNPNDVETLTVLKDAGATAADAVFTGPDGKKYRLPTAGELNLLLPMYTEPGDQPDIDGKKGQYCPWWNDNASTNTSLVTVETPFTETIYLKNGEDNLPDKSHPDDTDSEYTLKGQSQMKLGVLSETVHYYTTEPDDPQKGNYNIHPVYAVRFKGTSQYAAYRWESCRIADDPLERYFSIKIKALPADSELTVDDVADNVSFWRDGFIEFKFPASGYYAPEIGQPTPENITYRGVNGYCRSSSLWTGGSHVYDLRFSLNNAHMDHSALDNKYSLRLVKVSE